MQKVSVIGLDKIKGRLIARMMDLEAVQLTDQTEKLTEDFWAENTVQDGAQDQVTYFENKISRSSQALDIIDQYGELKSPLFKTRRIISKEEAASIPSQEIATEDLIARLIHLNEELRSKRDEINKLDLDNMEQLRYFLQQKDRWAFVSDSVARSFLNDLQLRPLMPQFEVPRRIIYCTCNRKKRNAPEVKAFLHLLHNELSALPFDISSIDLGA